MTNYFATLINAVVGRNLDTTGAAFVALLVVKTAGLGAVPWAAVLAPLYVPIIVSLVWTVLLASVALRKK